MRDGVERSERRERKKRKRWQVHGRSLEHVLNAIRRRGVEASSEAGAERREDEQRRARRRRA
jgi:hypothetical protein